MHLSVLHCTITYGVKKQSKMSHKPDSLCRHLVLARNTALISATLRGSDADPCIQVSPNSFVITGSLDLYGIKASTKASREED